MAGAFAGFAGALFGIFNRGVFPDFAYWAKSAEVLIMVILGGMGHFWGPAVGAAVLILLNQQINAYTHVLAVHPRLDPDRAAVRVSRRHRRRAAAPASRACGGGAMLEVRNIRKSFNGFTAVDGVSLAVPARGITAVIGPNGAGKSTLFNLLTGHLRADGGSVALEGRDITAAAPHAICRMGVGRSFQHTNIFRKLTVFENVQAALIAHGGQARNFWGRAEGLYRDETTALLASLGLADQADAVERRAVARQPEAARARHRARERSEAAAARRADRRHVGGRDARGDPAARAHRRGAQAHAAVHRARHGCGVLDRAEDRGAASGQADRRRARRRRCATTPEVRRVYLGGRH